MKRKITQKQLIDFKQHLVNEEKSAATIEKYVRDVQTFIAWLKGEAGVDKAAVITYKQYLTEHYQTASVNSILSALNSFFIFNAWFELRIKTIKMQRQIFSSKDRELSRAEYERLLKAAESRPNKRLYYILQTICATGIRVSELRFITIEAVKRTYAEVCCKGKNRHVLLPGDLCKLLKDYAEEKKISSGSIFVTGSGRPLDRSNVWADMKKLCETANVARSKVFPHNLRHLFARTYYALQKDIVRLADILGHSSVNTTRIYTMESGEIHRKQIQRLGLVHMRI